MFDTNFMETHLDACTQTEIHGTIFRKMDVVVVHDNPFVTHNLKNLKVPQCEQGSETMISNNIIDFIAQGSQKYETLMLHGLIRSVDINEQKVNETKVEDYIKSLSEQEKNDRVLFNKRKKNIMA